MKKANFLLLGILLFGAQAVWGQMSDAAFQKAYQRISTNQVFSLDRNNSVQFLQDSLEIVEISHLMDFLHQFLLEEHQLNGKAGFAFAGNETEINNLFKIGVGGQVDKGAYPYELDFSFNIQTVLRNGDFQENFSDIDFSFDFHPYVPAEEKKDDGLWLENFVFMKRFNNNFLGIEQRYEAGAGFIFNFYTSNKLTPKGNENLKALSEIPDYEQYGDNLKRCLEECYVKESVLGITAEEASTIAQTRERYKRSNIKKYSQLRLALLVGIYYELEQAQASNSIFFNGVDTLVTEDFEATNKLRMEFRPSLVWQPLDRYKFRLYPYFKLPLGETKSVVTEGDLIDERYDAFVDFLASLDVKLEKNFSLGFTYRMFYDHAPKRKFLLQNDDTYVLLVGQKLHNFYGIRFNFDF